MADKLGQPFERGKHPLMDEEWMDKKMEDEVYGRLEGRVTWPKDRFKPVAQYRKGTGQDTLNHERIHGYQVMNAKLDGARGPAWNELFNNILKDKYMNGFAMQQAEGDAVEYPAWLFEKDNVKEQGNNFNRYVDEMYKRAKGGNAANETFLPPKLHENYVKTHPRPAVAENVGGKVFEELQKGNKGSGIKSSPGVDFLANLLHGRSVLKGGY